MNTFNKFLLCLSVVFMAPYLTETFQDKQVVMELPISIEKSKIIKPSEFCSINTECKKLAEAIVWEARGEHDEGKYAVASVILNRVNHYRFPNTVTEVVHQRYQFSYLNDMHKQKEPKKSDWDSAYKIAYDVFFNENLNTSALFYLNPHNVRRMPKWSIEYNHIATIGNHNFYNY